MADLTLFSPEWMTRFREVINNDQELSWIAKFMTCNFVWQIGTKSYLFRVQNGKIQSIVTPTWNDSWDFTLEGSEEAWAKFARKVPPPLYHDLLGMVTRLPECRLIGNRLIAMQNIRSLTRMMSLAREV
jgi:hypothetical protein